MALLLLVPAVAVAAEPVETPPPAWGAPGEGAGAVAWWLLLGLSAVALAVLFEGVISIRRGRMAPPSTAEALDGAVRSRSLDQATKLGDDPAHDAMLTRMVLAGVRLARDAPDATADEVRSAARDEGEALVGRLHRRVNALGAIGAVAPLVGLLGTAMALSAALGRLAASGDSARAAEIAAAAGQALGTTVLGLLIAVPAVIASIWLRARVDAMTVAVGRSAEQILRPLGRR